MKKFVKRFNFIIAIILVLSMTLGGIHIVRAAQSKKAATKTETTETETAAAGDTASSDESKAEDNAQASEDAKADAATADAADKDASADAASADAAASNAGKVAKSGVYIEDINVEGMNADQIKEAISTKIAALAANVLHITVGDKQIDKTIGEFGLSYSNTDVVDQALAIGQKGNVLQRFKRYQDIQKNGPTTLNLTYTINDDNLNGVVQDVAGQVNHAAKNGSLTMTSYGVFTPVAGQDGVSLKVDDSSAKIKDLLTNQWRGGDTQITLDTDTVAAKGSADQLALVQTVLGEGSTNYTGSEGKIENLKVGASKLSGTVVYPGDEFSAEALMVPFTEANGYFNAPSYEDGRVVDSLGGGVCQVATTLYQALLQAELTITERQNHSMTVGYVPASMDAAIAEGLKDLKFVNNTDAPVYIDATVGGGTMTFTIFGHETRDVANRKVTYESETLTTTPPTDGIGTDPDLPFGQTGSSYGYTGKTARLWKIVTVGGVEQSREIFNESTYRMTPNLVTYGTDGATDEQKAALQAACDANDASAANAVIGG